jgi:hypothetical protein
MEPEGTSIQLVHKIRGQDHGGLPGPKGRMISLSYLRKAVLSQHAKQPKPSCPKCSSRKVEQLVSRFQAITNKKT